jgi:hypothetical protein
MGNCSVSIVSAEEFIRQLPSGLDRIRYYGFLANCHPFL